MLDDSPAYLTFSRLVRYQTALWNAVDARLRERHGVPLTHVTPLQVVAETPGCRVQDIVRVLHITVGGASKVVDRLEAAGHVVRTANPQDRRSSVLQATEAGLELLDRAGVDIEQVLAERFGAVPAADLAELDRVLAALQASGPAAVSEVTA